MKLGCVRFHIGFQSFQRHGGCYFSLPEPVLCIKKKNCTHSCKYVRSIYSCQTIPGLQTRDLYSGPGEGFCALKEFSLVVCFTFSHHQQCYLGHGRQISTCSHRSFLTYKRCNFLIQHFNQCHGNLRSYSGISMGMHISPSKHGTPYPFFRHWITNSGCVIINKIFLKIFYLIII